ncbi:MAG: hypothetical protein GF317_19895 [Candidatus Lokiarchaeota archaeon]|nr:hypothetical protein [Candidatus Lokiarchaeota archaeon]MBD3201756.1 hypothetical protein [Candidatus Lokiarchaeota archaeon]
MVNVKYHYCPVCKKEIEQPHKRPLDSMEKVIWGIVILATLGFGAIAFLIYYFGIRKKVYCPVCSSKLATSQEPFEKPEEDEEPKTPKEKIYKKAGKKIKKKEEKPEKKKEEKTIKKIKEGAKDLEEEEIYCPFCGNTIKKGTKKCPYCKSPIDR